MKLHRLWLALALIFDLGCDTPCTRDDDCPVNQRCTNFKGSSKGACTLCDPGEIAYDGVDNDCDPSTLENDLDGDGDNWVTAAVNAGMDCDDADPLVSSKRKELCGDGKDNDCDTMVDEVECRDFLPPTIFLESPATEAVIVDVLHVSAVASDDVGVAKVDVYLGDTLLASKNAAPFVFDIPGSQLIEGRMEVRAVATDVADRTAEASAVVRVDTRTPPDIEVDRPVAGGSYDGQLTIQAEVTDDGAGVGTVEATLDGQPLRLPRQPAGYGAVLETRGLSEGPHTLVIQASDLAGHVGTRSIDFRVDRSPPAVRVLTPTPNLVVQGVVRFVVEASDPSGIGVLRSSTGESSATSPWTLDVDTTRLRGGPQTVSFTVPDLTVVDDGTGAPHVGTGGVRVIVNDGNYNPCTETATLSLAQLPVQGDTRGGSTVYTPSCGGMNGSERAYRFVAPVDLVGLEVRASGNGFTPTVEIFHAYCGPRTRLYCGPASMTTPVAAEIRAGDEVVIVVDGGAAGGAFELELGAQIRPGHACDPAVPTFACRYGSCAGGTCPGADCLDGIDADEDGRLDEDLCAAPPLVTCPADQRITVLEQSAVSAAESRPVIERRWTVQSAPLGNLVGFLPPDQASTTLHPLLAGDYRGRYTVLSASYEYAACETVLHAGTLDDLRVELIWNVEIDEAQDPTDVDLHLLHPNATAYFSDLDCYFANGNPEWGSAGTDDDPRLDIDDTEGRGPENINILTAEQGGRYEIGVHYYSDDGRGPSQALINVFCYDTLVASFGPATLQDRELWVVGDVALDGTSCAVRPFFGNGSGGFEIRPEGPDQNTR